MEGRGRNQGRGLGRQGRGDLQGRGRGRGRGRNSPGRGLVNSSNVEYDSSDSEAEEVQDTPFASASANDSNDSDEEDDGINPAPPARPVQAAIPVGNQTHQVINELNQPEDVINIPFLTGRTNAMPDIRRFIGMSPFQLVKLFTDPLFEVYVQCTTAHHPSLQVTMKDFYAIAAILTLTCTVRVEGFADIWNDHPLFHWCDELASFGSTFSIDRFYAIRRHMKAYLTEDDIPDKRKSWKINRAIQAVRRQFKDINPTPGEILSLDEAMAQGTSTRNPLYVSVGKAKPLEGYRLFALVDFETKLIVDFMWDDKYFTSQNSSNFPGGFSGRIVHELLLGANLPGIGYKVFCDDNYYITEAIIRLMQEKGIYIGGTAHKTIVPIVARFGNAKHPKPSRAHPKGKLIIVKSEEDVPIYTYAWMDASACYFIDPMYGPGQSAIIHRRNENGERIPYTVPKFMEMYNNKMHGVDVFDQVRKEFGIDLTHTTNKYTTRVFEILFSMCLAQAFNLYRYLNSAGSANVMSAYKFKCNVISGFLSSCVAPIGQVMMPETRHTLQRMERDTDGRYKQLSCRNCPNKKPTGEKNRARETTYRCTVCLVGFHPECFDEWHLKHSPSYRPPLKKRRQPPTYDGSDSGEEKNV